MASDEATLKATGKTQKEWNLVIDAFGGADMSHKEIARRLWEDKLINSGWWCQSVTVEYEYARGRRVKGETAATGFEIGVQKTLPITAAKAWEFMTSDKGLSVWLGGNVDDIRLEKGEPYQTADGTKGEIRTIDPGKRVRLTWQPKDRNASTTLQIYLLPSGKNTSVRFHHEKLSGTAERQAMKKHWQNVLAKLEQRLP